ncbi:MAG TPA: nucleotide exchange factor GrpE, partial [Marisediminicola sp.]|nr:nucleotide exchange factor GrpE [Marisediminicola sp.]
MTDQNINPDSENAEPREPMDRDDQKVDPERGAARGSGASAPEPRSEDGDTASVDGVDDLIQAEDADVETTLSENDLNVFVEAEQDLLADMRNDLLRAQAELVNFRMRVERDRAANREAVIAEVVRTLLPAMDDLSRAETHGDLEGGPLALVAQKLRGGFEKYGLRLVGEKGEPFDPNLHEALVQLPSPDVTINTVA